MNDKKDCVITFGATNSYVFALANVLLGIKKYTTPFWDTIIVFHTDITLENQQIINAILPCEFVAVDDLDWCEQLNKKLEKSALKMYSIAAFFRYYCFDLLNEYRKVIWLDCDLLVQNDISGIQNYGKKTGFAACMADRMAPMEMCFNKLIPGYQMFIPLVNSGTLVLTDKLSHYEELCDWCKKKTVEYAEYLDMPDQGVLNLMLQDFHITVEPIDVTKYQCYPDSPKAISPQSAYILHAYGTRKFWNDPIYQERYPEWQTFNQQYIHLSEEITKKTCIDYGRPPLVSVVMSPYVRDDFLQEAVNSILEQTYKYFELIVVVEYSDKQEEIAEKLRKFQDSRIIVICNKERLGFANSLNVGIKAAKGEYIARMDDDDISYPARLQKQVEYMELHPNIDILGTYAETFMNNHDVWNWYPTDPEQAAIGLLRGTVLCHPTVMMRKSRLEKYNLQYDPNAFTEDYDLWARAVKYLKICNLPEVLYGYRDSGMNITVNQEVKVHISHLSIMRMQCKEYLGIDPSDDEVCLFNGRLNTLGMVYTKNRGEADRIYDEFVHKIASANQRTGFYNQEKLEDFLGLQKNGNVVKTGENKVSFLQRTKKAVKKVLKPFVDRIVLIFGRNICNLVNARMDECTQSIGQAQRELLIRISEIENAINTHGKWNTDDIKKELFNFRFMYEKHESICTPKTATIYSSEFYENNRYHSYISAIEVFEKLFPAVLPNSILDFGCGSGTWLYAAKKFGVSLVHGVDGNWVDRKMLMIEEAEFEAHDVSQPYHIMKKYDMVCSLEVAEHIMPERSDVFIENLCNSGDIVLFSAAHPNQGGDGHINERPYDYWKDKFEEHGYFLIDIRPMFANNEKICIWYRDNMGLYIKGKCIRDEIKNRLGEI